MWSKSTKNHNLFIFNKLRCPLFDKKNVAKCPGFSYCHCQLHRMVPGRTGFALRRDRRETRKN